MSAKLGGNILVTGANRGLGLELVRQLLQVTSHEDHIYAGCREPEGSGAQALRELAKGNPTRITVIKLDVGDESSISAAVQALGEQVATRGLNLLINNAAINTPEAPIVRRANPTGLSATGACHMMDVYRVNVVGPFLLVKYLLPHLQRAAEQHGGQGGHMSCRRSAIINLSSVFGSVEKCPDFFSVAPMYPYRTSKAALHMLTRCQSEDFRKHHILVTAIHPGWVQTDMGGKDAPLTSQESILGMLGVMSSLSDKDSGKLLDWQGNSVPW